MSNKKYFISKFNCPSSVLAHTFILLLLSLNSEHFLFFFCILFLVYLRFFFSLLSLPIFSSILYPFHALKSLFLFLSFNISFSVIFSQALFLFFFFDISVALCFRFFNLFFVLFCLHQPAFLKKLCLCKHHTFSTVYLSHINNF